MIHHRNVICKSYIKNISSNIHCLFSSKWGAIRKAEHWGIDAFELWCWRRLRVPWTARRSNQSIPKEINPEYSLEGLMLKLQYFGHQMGSAVSLEKALTLGKIEGRKRRGQQEMVGWHHQLKGHEFGQAPGNSEGPGSLACCSPWGQKGLDMTERLNNNNYPVLPISEGWVRMRETVSAW